MKRKPLFGVVWIILAIAAAPLVSQDLLENLGRPQQYRSLRISSYDRTGGNRDALPIEPGATAVLADIQGSGAIHHIWVTIAAEPFYGRKLILRMYWDGEKNPSVEAPIGDFFGVGHGLNRNFSSLPINCSSEGRARNCYWFMPFRKSARVTVTNEGTEPVGAFYYYIDYRALKELLPDTPSFHAQYRQEMPCLPNKNYLLLEAEGRGHYAGCNLSILQRSMGWWGEGDDMIYVDGESSPSLHGTGSEDYFSDAWGMREDENLFYGCPLQEDDFQAGSKATVYRFHIPDPIPFQKSIRVTIEHGHANDRSDYYSSVSYWYQAEPHKPFPPLPPVSERLPFALVPPVNFVLPKWQPNDKATGGLFEDKDKGWSLKAEKLVSYLTSFYSPDGSRYPVVSTDGAQPGSQAELTFPAEVRDRYNIELYFLTGSGMGDVSAMLAGPDEKTAVASLGGYSSEPEIGKLILNDVILEEGLNTLTFTIVGRNDKARASELGFVGMSLIPNLKRFLTGWNLIGPFEAPDMTYLSFPYPPETEIAFEKEYPGKEGGIVGWKTYESDKGGMMKLAELFQPSEQAIVYGLAYVYSPRSLKTHLLLGSDDGVRVWLNDALIHSNPAYRGAYPDQDKVPVTLHPGWNKVLIKVLQGAGGWGFYLRIADPEGVLRYGLKPEY
jgi:hypothetical protein